MPQESGRFDLDRAADDISSKIILKKFPWEYLRETDEHGMVTVPSGNDIIMFRQMEGVSLLIDGQAVFFNDAIEAKYIYYCAKSRLTEVPMPDRRAIKRIIREFNEDLGNWKIKVEELARSSFPENADEVIEACLRKSGYYEILDE